MVSWGDSCFVRLAKYYSSDQIMLVGVGGGVSRMGERRDAYRVLMGTLEGKRPLEALGHTWENIIKLDFKEIRSGCGLHSSA